MLEGESASTQTGSKDDEPRIRAWPAISALANNRYLLASIATSKLWHPVNLVRPAVTGRDVQFYEVGNLLLRDTSAEGVIF